MGRILGRLPAVVRWAGLGLLAGLISIWLASGPLKNLEYASGDLLFGVRNAIAPIQAPPRTMIVAIDDASFSVNQMQWPWPRDYLATIVDHIAAGKPRAIAIDIFLYEVSDPAKDAALAQAIHNAGNVVLVNDISVEKQGSAVLTRLNRPIPEINQAVSTLGLTNFDRDRDGVVRRLLSFQGYSGQPYYSWAMQSARLYDGAADFRVISADQVDIAARQVLLESQFMRVNFRGPAGTIPTVSAYQVASGLVDVNKFEGKVVLLGATSESLHDSYPTPFGSQPPTPGVEINANAIETILNGDYIIPVSPWLSTLITLIMALIGVALAIRLESRRALLAGIAGMVLYVALCAALFVYARVLPPVVIPLFGLGLAFASAISIQLYNEQRQRAQVQSLFERYVAPAAIDQMLSQPETYASGGQRKELTILFSDIRGFTSLSENLPPDDVVAILNQYLARMTELIFEHGGTIDKFEGDAILAIWNAPLPVEDHATRAVQCGVEMIAALETLQESWAQKSTAPLKIGVGINTGQAFVGNIGSDRRMDYTVIGDTVNLASRLQDLTKAEGVPLLFSEATRALLNPAITTRFVSTAQVKGRAQAVNVYTVEQKRGDGEGAPAHADDPEP